MVLRPDHHVDSPTGSGKTTLVAEVVAYLRECSNLRIIMASATRRAGYDITEGIAAERGPDRDGNPQVTLSVSNMKPLIGVCEGGAQRRPEHPDDPHIASCKTTNGRPAT
jgi:hypothetical protein